MKFFVELEESIGEHMSDAERAVESAVKGKSCAVTAIDCHTEHLKTAMEQPKVRKSVLARA